MVEPAQNTQVTPLHPRSDERKIRARLEEVGYDADNYELVSYTSRHALIRPRESRWFSIIHLPSGREEQAVIDRTSALEAFAVVAERDRREESAER